MIDAAAGLALGLAGSAHCAAMCGPLVVAIGRGRTSRADRLRHDLLYHAGRITTYAVFGLGAGVLGSAFRLVGLGHALAIGTGVLLIAGAFAHPRVDGGGSGNWASAAAGAVAAGHRWAWGRPFAGPLLTGALNGILPCGLTYAAVAAAAAHGSPASAATFMVAFGVGTTPALVAAGLAAAGMPAAVRTRLRRLAPVAMALLGALLIARGVFPQHHATAGRRAEPATHQH